MLSKVKLIKIKVKKIYNIVDFPEINGEIILMHICMCVNQI